MKITRRVSLLACLFVVLATPTVHAEAVPLNDQQIELVRRNCIQIQSSMQRLERIETVARRNRGVGYESTLKLMAALNSRVAANKLNVPEFIVTAAEMEKRVNDFDRNYITYNNSFHTTMKFANCQQQPVTFYDYLNQTRELRARVGTDVEAISKLLDDYQKSLDKLKQTVGVNTESPQ